MLLNLLLPPQLVQGADLGARGSVARVKVVYPVLLLSFPRAKHASDGSSWWCCSHRNMIVSPSPLGETLPALQDFDRAGSSHWATEGARHSQPALGTSVVNK